MRISIVVTLSCALLAVPAGAQLVPDLTGTWEGRWSCKIFNGAKHTEGNKQSVFQITQMGTAFGADLDSGGYHWNGAVIADAKNTANKGEAVLIQCGTDNLPLIGSEAEIIRATVKTKPNSVKATLTGLSIFENGSDAFGTCRYSYKRTTLSTGSTIGACP